MGAGAVVWFKRDLRWRDPAPLLAAQHFEGALGLYIIERAWPQSAQCDARHVSFALACVAQLRTQLATRGLPLQPAQRALGLWPHFPALCAPGHRGCAAKHQRPQLGLRAAWLCGPPALALPLHAKAGRRTLYGLRGTAGARDEAQAIQQEHGSRKSGLPQTTSAKRSEAAKETAANSPGQGELF
jgi:DNA photolyase